MVCAYFSHSSKRKEEEPAFRIKRKNSKERIIHRRFKLYTINKALGMIKGNCYISIIHLAVAYYLVTLKIIEQ